MKHIIINLAAHESQGDAVVVGLYKGGTLTTAAKAINTATGGVLTRLIESGEITGKANELTPILAPAGVAAEQVIVVGLGEQTTCNAQAALRAAGTAARHLAGRQRQSVAMQLDTTWDPALLESAVAGATIACVGQDLYQAEPSLHPLPEIAWPPEYAEAISSGDVLGQAVNLCRRLVNEPASKLYPETFADQTQDMAGQCGLEVEVWDEERLDQEKCQALLAVARGSSKPARLVILKHNGGTTDQPTLGLVGKGVTFDAGGLSIKPNDGMKTMKCDMAGAAAVVAALQAISRLQLPVNVMGIVGLVENMLGGDAYKLGDVLTARNGTTIEVHNTDAEGRLVLADALCVAVDHGADRLVDLATLTGACVVALGEDIVGVMTNDETWCAAVRKAADAAGEEVWQLPMSHDFGEQIKSKVADIKNVGAGRWGGAITAAKLLERFVSERPWVHLDIAGPSFLDKPKPWLDAGGTGVTVRTLVELCRQLPSEFG